MIRIPDKHIVSGLEPGAVIELGVFCAPLNLDCHLTFVQSDAEDCHTFVFGIGDLPVKEVSLVDDDEGGLVEVEVL